MERLRQRPRDAGNRSCHRQLLCDASATVRLRLHRGDGTLFRWSYLARLRFCHSDHRDRGRAHMTIDRLATCWQSTPEHERITPMTKRIADLAPEYAPYNQLPEFEEGLCAFALGIY